MSSNKVEMKKTMNLFNCIALIVGVIIGSGIFISPKGIVQDTGSVGLSLIVWGATGIISLFGAITYSELGCMIPKAGGEYEYLNVAFGPLPAFLFIWSFIVIIIPASCALSGLIFADYILQAFYGSDCQPPLETRMLLGACAICM
jgi:solute carrier family 7 (L-type amino acid transporter), member 5